MTNPLVSIITPTYNHDRFIAECIESVKAQTYKNWEMIIVDDGSSDGTWKIVKSYVNKDKRIRAFRQENKGIWRLSETYNFALERSQGDLIGILEGDDVWAPSKLSIQVPAHLASGYPFSFGHYQCIDASGNLISPDICPDMQTPFLLEADPKDLFTRFVLCEYILHPITTLITKEYLIRVGGFEEPSYMPVVDYPTFLALGAAGGGYYYIPEVFGCWRQSSGQVTWQLARDVAYGAYRFAQEFADRMGLDLGIPPGTSLESYLRHRYRHYLSDSSYRAAAVAFEKGEVRNAWRYCAEIAQLHQYDMLVRCLSMFGWKSARKLLKGAAGLALINGSSS